MAALNATSVAVREDEPAGLKAQFLASLNHEIRTPLTGILGMADLLQETTLDGEQKEYVATVRTCAEDLLALFNKTLEYSELSAGQVLLAHEEFNLPEALRDSVLRHAAAAQSKGLRLACRLAPDLPHVALGDAPRLQQAVSHIVENAVKFTKQGRVEVAVAGDASASILDLRIRVSDTGVGIPAEKLVTVFESFRQLDGGLAREQTGLGLGLALVRKLIFLMGGDLTVESEAGRGSTFTLAVPLILPGGEAGAVLPDRAEALLVEDNEVAQRVVTHILRRANYVVECASSGSEAVALAGRRRYDFILMDLQMPGMDGFQACAEIRRIPGFEGVPVIALTANATDDYRSLCLRAGMQGFVPKPVQRGELLSSIESVLAHRAPHLANSVL
jgi:hypothetical protein